MRVKHLFILGLFITGLSLSGCKDEPKDKPKDKPTPPPKKEVTVSFDADSAYSYVQAQVDFGPRVPGTAAHANCVAWMEEKLAEYCDTAFVMTGTHTDYDQRVFHISNVMGVFNPDATKRFLLGAHYDTRPQSDEDPEITDKPADGANDGASGVGVLIEIARQLAELNPTIGIDIVFFDYEDAGETGGRMDTWCIGSQHWADIKANEGYIADGGILLDMVGAKDATFALEAYSISHNQNLMLNVWATGQKLGYGKYFLNIAGGVITDDHLFVQKRTGVPMIDIIHYDLSTSNNFPDHWHKQSDNMDAIDKNTLQAVGHTVLHVLMNSYN